MWNEDDLIDFLKRSLKPVGEGPPRSQECLAAPRFWEVLLRGTLWEGSEREHLGRCTRCSGFAARIRELIDARLKEAHGATPAATRFHLLTEGAREPGSDAWEGDAPGDAAACTVAAASADQEETLYHAVCRAAAAGHRELTVSLEDGSRIPLFRLFPEERVVEPSFDRNRTIVIDIPRFGRQEVTTFGGVVIPWEDLKTMRATISDAGAKIVLTG